MAAKCMTCKTREVECIGGWESSQCRRCNDQDIQRNENRREWDYFHDEPCPEIELSKPR